MRSTILNSWSLFVWMGLVAQSVNAEEGDWWSRRMKRALPADGDGIVIPLSTDALGRYVASVGMGNNGKTGPVQNLSFVLSASSPYSAAASAGCTSCVAQIGSSSLYDPSLSQTKVPLNGSQTITIGDSSTKGVTMSEACGFLQQNGSFWWYPNQTVVLANTSNNFFANGASGLLGLGRSAGSASFIDTIFRNHQAWQNLTIGLAFNGGSNPSGVMDLRATDPELYTDEIKYASIVKASADVPSNMPADWSLHLDSWAVKAGTSLTQESEGGVAIVEPYFPEIRFPQDQARIFYRDVAGAEEHEDATGLTWTIPCKPSLSLEVTFSNHTFSVGADQLVTSDATSGKCIGVVQGWESPFVQSYMFGKAFAQTVYIVYNANRNGTDTIGFAPRSNPQGVPGSNMTAGAIAGISVGATIGFVLLLLLAFLWWRHRRVKRLQHVPIKTAEGKALIQPFTPVSPGFSMNAPPSSVPYTIEHGPIGGEAGNHTPLLSSSSPNSSPMTTSMSTSQRRKAQEAGYLDSGMANAGSSLPPSTNSRTGSSGRPASSHTQATSSDFIQILPTLPGTPNTPGTPGGSQLQHQQQQAVAQHHLSVPPRPAGTPHQSVINPHHSVNPSDSHASRHFSTVAQQALSPTSPGGAQIHYHIHLPPGAATAANFPAGSIIHEYDEPAPEYSERPGSRAESASNVSTSLPSPVHAPESRPLPTPRD